MNIFSNLNFKKIIKNLLWFLKRPLTGLPFLHQMFTFLHKFLLQLYDFLKFGLKKSQNIGVKRLFLKRKIFGCKKQKFWCKKNKNFGVKKAKILVYKNWCQKIVPLLTLPMA